MHLSSALPHSLRSDHHHSMLVLSLHSRLNSTTRLIFQKCKYNYVSIKILVVSHCSTFCSPWHALYYLPDSVPLFCQLSHLEPCPWLESFFPLSDHSLLSHTAFPEKHISFHPLLYLTSSSQYLRLLFVNYFAPLKSLPETSIWIIF